MVVAVDGVTTDEMDGVEGGVWMPAIAPREPLGEPDDGIGDGMLYLYTKNETH